MITISLHDYVPDPSLPQKDGVNFGYAEIANMLRQKKSKFINVRFHDFIKLLQDEKYAVEVLSGVDCVVSNVGPYAYFYFYLRERFHLNYRIVRDVREALRGNCLLQEFLSAPYLRETDTLLVTSCYTKKLYHKIFPHLVNGNTKICYPLMYFFPPHSQSQKRHQSSKEQVVLGYVGRLSEDKNFPQLIDLIILLQKSMPRRYKLIAVGDVHSQTCNPLNIQQRIVRETGANDIFEYVPPVKWKEVWKFYKQFDLFLFPSTSNIETFGRVLIEASHFGLPVIASEHAASPELIPSDNLVPVDYFYDRVFNMHSDFPLGTVKIEDVVTLLEKGVQPSKLYKRYERHPDLFLKIISGIQDDNDDQCTLSENIRSFIDSIELIGLPPLPDISQASSIIETLIPWFLDLQRKGTMAYKNRIRDLLKISRYPDRTSKFIKKNKAIKGDFTNAGGIDFELLNVVSFFPQFVLRRRQ